MKRLLHHTIKIIEGVQIMTLEFAHKLGLGTNKVGGHNLFDNLDEQDGYDLVRAALDAGINVLDTAFVYGLGRSEEIIGDVIQDYDRSKIIIATKGAQNPDKDYEPDNSPEFLVKTVEESLKRLKTDYIDIFYIHFPDDTSDKLAAVEALDKLKQEGKIRAIGVSNFSFDQLKEANATGKVDFDEDYYSLAHRDQEQERFDYLRENGIGFVPYFPLESGLLTGRYGADDRDKFDRLDDAKFDQIIKGLDVLKQVADAHDATLTHTVLAWYMANPNIGLVIPGARNGEQATDLAKSIDVHITEDEYNVIDEAFKA